MAFLEDPRLRQRWNQIALDAEAVTENAAAGIWSFQHHYINPCLGSVANSIEQCTAICLGDPEERLRRRRERERAHGGAEYSFDFYDDWYEEEQGGGLLGSWGGEDWDRLLAGTGGQRKHARGETAEQPRRKRGMSYGTRAPRRRTSEHDPIIIPSTQPIGLLSKLPWKLGGTLRYKPSAADLQDRPGKHDNAESEPLLRSDDASDHDDLRMLRQRSDTTGSGDTSDSYRSRGDLFPSDGEGEEDAVPLGDDVTYDMIRKDDRSSGRTRSSKGKRPADRISSSRTDSRTTLGSAESAEPPQADRPSKSRPPTPDAEKAQSLADLEMQEERLRQEEESELARKKAAAARLAAERGLEAHDAAGASASASAASWPESHVAGDEIRHEPEPAPDPDPGPDAEAGADGAATVAPAETAFQAARLPKFS